MKIEQLEKLGLDVRPGANKPGKVGVEFYMNCPFCVKRGKPTPDTGYKMGFNIKKGVYHCYRCDARGDMKDIRELAILAEYHTDISDDEILRKLNAPKVDLAIPEFDLDLFSYPFEKEETPIAYHYMLQRGYTEQELSTLKLRVGKSFQDAEGNEIMRWAGRVIFPYFYEGKCIYVVGRSHTGRQPKYLNATAPKGLVVYGLEEIQGKIVILCEGIISAHAAQRYSGIPAVAVLGKDPLELQLNRIRNKCEVVYVSLDGDVEVRKKKQLWKRLEKMGFQVWDVELPNGEDPDSLKEQYTRYFEQATKVSLF